MLAMLSARVLLHTRSFEADSANKERSESMGGNVPQETRT